MTRNRFLANKMYLENSAASAFSTRGFSNGHQKSRQQQQAVREEVIEGDLFILDVLAFFFRERLDPSQLNDSLRNVAVEALDRATTGSRIMDLVPRPPSGPPSIVWLVSQAVQIGFRRTQNRGQVYEAVRVAVAAALRNDYRLAKMGQGFSNFVQPMSNHTTSNQGIEFIKQFESFRANLYNDAAGHCTIGYGTLVHRGQCDGSESAEFRAGITEARATELLRQEVARIESVINTAVTATLNQHQFDALVSFAYNVGTGAFQRSTLLQRLNAGEYDAVPSELRRWIYANGRVLRGLERRREAESRIFTSGDYPTGQSVGTRALTGPRSFSAPRGVSRSMAASDRVLVVLLENRGVSLDLDPVIDYLLDLVPFGMGSLLPDDIREQIASIFENGIRDVTDFLLEEVELLINRYQSAVPDHYGEVVILRNSTAVCDELKNTLISKTEEEKIIDLLVLTHGNNNCIATYGTTLITGSDIRAIRAENGGNPIRLRAVYMMNCKGSSLNDDWTHIGAKASVGSVRNNNLPEPTMHFFWQYWKSGQSLASAAANAYQSTIDLFNGLVGSIPVIGGTLESLIDFENQGFVKDSAPVVQGDGSVTINSDSLSFTQSLFGPAMAVTVMPVKQLRAHA